MSFPEKNLNQTAVYWGNPTPTGFGAEMTYDDPVEIDCRWEDSTRLITATDGKEIACRAEVQVNQDLDEQGLLYLGELNDLDSADEENPIQIAAAYKIQRFDKIPTIRGDKFFRKAFL